MMFAMGSLQVLFLKSAWNLAGSIDPMLDPDRDESIQVWCFDPDFLCRRELCPSRMTAGPDLT